MRAWTKRYRHFKTEATSAAESAHGRFKDFIQSGQDNVVTVTEAMEQYFKADINRIKVAFEKSSMERMTQFLRYRKLLQGIEFNVSHWAIKHMMRQMEYEKNYGKPGDVCICPNMSSLGLPCRHMLVKYEEVIPIEVIDPFWKQLSFDPPPSGDPQWIFNFVDLLLDVLHFFLGQHLSFLVLFLKEL